MKRIFATSFIALGALFHAQSIGNSPYAAFGLGDVKYDNTIDITAMGGISTAYISDLNNKFNFSNPAANGNLGLTSFNIETTNENNFFKSNYQDMKSTKHSTYLSNISVAFPLSQKLKFGLGYQPYSSKTYEISTSKAIDETTTQYNAFHGKGSISTVQAALAYNISEALAVGFRTNFYFGKIYDTEELTFSNVELINGYETSNKVKSFNFTAGTTYQKKLKNDRKFTVGATYTFGTTGEMETQFTNSTYYYSTSTTPQNRSIIEQTTSNSKNLIPQQGSLGIGYGHDGKWFYSTQIDFKKGGEFLFLGQPMGYADAYRIAAGGWILPNYNNFRNYFSRVIYRFGAYYEKGNLSITPANSTSSTNVNKFALTGGLTLPFANSPINRMNSIDLGFEVGKRGTLNNNMISQTFVNFKLGLNFADKWFQKRQYD
ncbi:hypothetical protein ACFFUE_09335 [Bergeyella porcorum]|uniref:hypothetical protein n=1 Tax=Bergeyella porcorum TaxID=1735111 RepID=UPI0035EADB26